MARVGSPLLWAALVAGLACGGAPEARPGASSTATDPATAGTVMGRVTFEGDVPPTGLVRLDADRACVMLNGGDQQPDDALIVGPDKGLGNVFVYVKTGLEKATFPIPGEPVVVDQQKCRYLPRVVGVRVGQPLRIRNGDPLLHNVRSASAINEPFNQGQPVQGMVFSHTFTTREVMVPVTCDVHAWMRAYVGALDHPYFAVTDETGVFRLPDLPAGHYTLEAWHERLGTRELPVALSARESKDVRFTFGH